MHPETWTWQPPHDMSAVSTWCFVPQTFDSILLVPESFLCFAFQRGDFLLEGWLHTFAASSCGGVTLHAKRWLNTTTRYACHSTEWGGVTGNAWQNAKKKPTRPLTDSLCSKEWIWTLNVVSSVLWRVQYKDETPNQSLKLKTLDVVSSVLWRVQYKDETPNQSLKLKTLNVVSSILWRAQYKDETPNQFPKIKNPKRGL